MTLKKIKEVIQLVIDTSDKAVVKAIMAIYKGQTGSEKVAGQTHEYNGIGFSSFDAKILSSFAQFYNRYGYLTPKQISYGRKKVKKYWRQLHNISGEWTNYLPIINSVGQYEMVFS